MNPEDVLAAEPPPHPTSSTLQSATWTTVNEPGRNRPVGNSTVDNPFGDTVGDTEAELRVDQSNARHVDTSNDQVYDINAVQDVGHWKLAVGGQPAKLVMRNHLETLLPRELVQDEFGTVVTVNELSSQHLAKLQGKVWRDLPLMVAMTTKEVHGEVTKECIMTAQAVCYISELLSKMNRVFILHPRSKQHCHAALCQHIHEKLKKPYSEHEVTLEPLVDWMTLDPVADITPLWFTLFRRNKSLLHKFALTNSKFVPRKPLRFCLECLSFMADERNLVWCIIKEEPDIIYADVPMPWPMSNHDNDGNKSEEKGNKSSEEPWSSDSDSDDSNSDESDKTITALKPAATHELPIPNVDGAFDFKANPSTRKFEIWRDPTIDQVRENSTPAIQLTLRPQERQATNITGWTPINVPVTITPSNEPMQPSVDAGRRFGQELDRNLHNVRVEGSYYLMPPPDLESTDADIETEFETPEFETPELQTTESDNKTTDVGIPTTGPDDETPVFDIDSAYVLIPTPRMPHNAFILGDSIWPALKEDVSPVPARPPPGCKVTPEDLYPNPNHLICFCKQPAKTGIVRIVQCKNTECFIRWYHYACLKDRKEKGVARFGTLLCELCKGEEYWGKTQGETDLSMPFSQKEVLDGIMSMIGGSGGANPYGLGDRKVHNTANELDELD